MSPDWQKLHKTISEDFWAEEDAKSAEAKEWGFDQSPGFSFAQASEQDWCKHSERELKKFLKNAGYPPSLKLVTEVGYKKLLADRQKARREANKKRMRLKREKNKDQS